MVNCNKRLKRAYRLPSTHATRHAGSYQAVTISINIVLTLHILGAISRIQHKGKPFRVFFAFDPLRQAVMLCGGDKTGDKHFYETMIPGDVPISLT